MSLSLTLSIVLLVVINTEVAGKKVKLILPEEIMSGQTIKGR